jgi:hypothetical protein
MSDPTAPVPEAPRPAPFDPRRLARQVITLPLAQLLEREPDALHSVVIDLNTDYMGGRDKAWERVLAILRKVLGDVQVIDTKANEKLPVKGRWCRLQFSQYVVVNGVTRKEVQDIVDADIPPAEKSDPTHLATGAPPPLALEDDRGTVVHGALGGVVGGGVRGISTRPGSRRRSRLR